MRGARPMMSVTIPRVVASASLPDFGRADPRAVFRSTQIMKDRPRLLMMRLLGPIALLVVAGGIPRTAWADWGLAGAQYTCSPKTKTFEVLPYDRSSDSTYDSVLGTGFKIVKPEHPRVTCRLGEHTLSAVVSVYAPGNGEGQGAGSVRISSISIIGVELFPDAPEFERAWAGDTEMLTRVRVIDMGHAMRVE